MTDTDKLRLWAVSLFGVESVTADELKRMGFENIATETGRVLFDGTAADIARANIGLRTAERVLLHMGEFRAESFEELFQGVKALPWDELIPADGEFPVKGHSLHSALHSIPDCQAIIKKAIVEKLKEKHRVEWFPEAGARYRVQFSILRDTVRVGVDTSGEGLHKRGYRAKSGEAPLKETLAAAMVLLSRYRGYETLFDPLCGSGTILIEAGLIAQNRAPGLARSFDAERWALCPREVWEAERTRAREAVRDLPCHLFGSDNDPEMVSLAAENAKKAGLGGQIVFEQKELRDIEARGGAMITNPPYGERLLDREKALRLYSLLGKKTAIGGLRRYILSPDEDFERSFGGRAGKKRKLYNGMIKCELFMYPDPEKEPDRNKGLKDKRRK